MGGKWVHALKEPGQISKARHVAKAYSQTEGIDDHETLAYCIIGFFFFLKEKSKRAKKKKRYILNILERVGMFERVPT